MGRLHTPGARSRRFAAWLALAALLAAVPARAAGPAAMITDLEGAVQVRHETGEAAGAILDALAPGAMLTVAAGAELTLVYLDSGVEYRFAGPARLRLGAESPEPLDGAPGVSRTLAVADTVALDPASLQDYGQAAFVMRGADGGASAVELLGPANTKVLDPRPEFRWNPIPGAQEYRFVLLHPRGVAMADVLVRGTHYRAPEEAALIPGQRHTWQVQARTPAGTVASPWAEVRLAGRGERARAEAARPAPGADVSARVVYALALQSLGLHDDARREWAVLSRERPESARLRVRAGR